VGPGLSNYLVASDNVLDLTTGLVWERSPPPSGLDWAGVNARCAALRVAGQSDWRVPTRIEMLSILDYTQIEGLYLSQTIFGSTAPQNGNNVWTSSSIDLVTPVMVGQLVVETYFGWTPVVLTDSASHALSMCVRSGCVAGAATRFVVSTDVALDANTGLTWQRAASTSALTFSAAQTYCTGLSAGGKASGWRLPNIRELASIFDETQHTLPMWPQSVFSSSAGAELWSSTPVAGGSPRVFALGFSDDVDYDFIRQESSATGSFAARCVHDP
jgi:hypothetical protein